MDNIKGGNSEILPDQKSGSNEYSISLCICTMNRHKEIVQCLESVSRCIEKPDEIIVSDDSQRSCLTKAAIAPYPSIIYQEGPRRGLAPNRNSCIQNVSSNYVIFIDDDVCVPIDFFVKARTLIKYYADQQIIITGYEMNHREEIAQKVIPHNPDFWGLQRVPTQGECRSIVINSTIFPRRLFQDVLFDEFLQYGSEEIDVAQHATNLGYKIFYNDDLYVNHYPSLINRDHYRSFVDASRLYVTTKIYWQYEHSLFKTLTYILLAPLQLSGSAIRKRGFSGLWAAIRSIELAFQYLVSSIKAVE